MRPAHTHAIPFQARLWASTTELIAQSHAAQLEYQAAARRIWQVVLELRINLESSRHVTEPTKWETPRAPAAPVEAGPVVRLQTIAKVPLHAATRSTASTRTRESPVSARRSGAARQSNGSAGRSA